MITPAKFSIFITTVNTMLGEAYTTTPTLYDKFTTTIPMDSEYLTFGWTGMLPQMRPWVGSRVAFEHAPQTYTVGALPFESTLAVDRFDLDDDKFGIYYRDIPDIARQAKRWPDLQMRNLLENASPWTSNFQLGLDGLTHWNTAHAVDLYDSSKSTYCNDFTGGGQTIGGILIGGAFGATSFKTLYEYQLTLKAEDGEPMGLTPRTLMYPPQLHGEVELVLKNESFAPPAWGTITGQVGAADNIFRRYGVEPLMNPLLKSATKFYLLNEGGGGIKPFAFGLREAPNFVQRISENDPVVFDDHKYLFGNWARGCPAWSFAWLSARSGS